MSVQKKEKASLTRIVDGHDDGPVLQLHRLPLVQSGGRIGGSQQHPQGGPHHGAVIQRQVVAEVPRLVVPEPPMEHDLRGKACQDPPISTYFFSF